MLGAMYFIARASFARPAVAGLLALFALLGTMCEFADEEHAVAAAAPEEPNHGPAAPHQIAGHLAWCDELVIPASTSAQGAPSAVVLPVLAWAAPSIVGPSSRWEGKAAVPVPRPPLFVLHAALLI